MGVQNKVVMLGFSESSSVRRVLAPFLNRVIRCVKLVATFSSRFAEPSLSQFVVLPDSPVRLGGYVLTAFQLM
jgi:hypothetical protein